MSVRNIIFLICLMALTGCASNGFKFSSFAKSDIDMVAEIHLNETLGQLRVLMEKLYRRNPKEWKKGGHDSVDDAVARVFGKILVWTFPELHGKTGADCIFLTFRDDYEGDRVLAFTVGLATMIMASYANKTEYYVIDTLNPQKLNNSARNVEIAAWKLSNTRNLQGQLYLVSNALDVANPNLSFERIFGKIIAQQDTMATIVADKTNRTIRTVILNMAMAVFLPI